MLYLTILLVVLVLSALLLFLIFKGFKNPVNPHDTIPEDLGLPIQEIRFPSVSGNDLYAWKIVQNPQAPTVILVHGWGRNVERMTPYMRKLCCNGFNMLAFDARGHGNSHPEGLMNMSKFAEDIESAIAYIESDSSIENKSISLIGLSIGGASSIYAASKNYQVEKVVTVGAFAHPAEVVRKQLSDRYVPYFPFTWLFFNIISWKTGIDFEAIAPVNTIAKAQAKFLLIHGDKDKVVPLEQAKKLKQAQPKVDLWIIPERGHSNCHLEDGFWEKVIGFLQKD